MQDEICNAIANRNLIEFSYKEHYRLVEPYTLGVNTRGATVLSAFQVGGQSSTRPIPCWGQFNIEEIKELKITTQKFTGNNIEYRRDDSRMTHIYCQL